MRFTTEADKLACEAQLEVEQIQKEMLEAGQRGDAEAVITCYGRLTLAISKLAEARAKTPKAECRHCGREFHTSERHIELVVSAVVTHEPDEIPIIESFERGQELHVVYCSCCADDTSLMMYLKKR